jgi:small ligand-binding sensory domain FIST
LVFASDQYQGALSDMLGVIRERLEVPVIAGCTGQAIISGDVEVEDQPSVSVMPLSLPGASIRPFHLRHQDVVSSNPAEMRRALATDDEPVNAWLVFGDPFSFDLEGLVRLLEQAYPGTPLLGGMASARVGPRNTQLFVNGDIQPEGCVLVAIGGDWTIEPVVSQGAEPLGEPWTITGVDRNIIKTIGGRPALQVLIDTVQELPADMQERAGRNLLVGLAIDEYREQFARGDFLIRNLMGADQDTGAVAIGAYPREGQTVQFHMRDKGAADEELRLMLETAQLSLGSIRPAGALICSCNGRGIGLFGAPNHDASAVAERFGSIPAAGFFCNGEVGPVGSKSFVHGFTASIGLFVPRSAV